jgi:hypothetical protein
MYAEGQRRKWIFIQKKSGKKPRKIWCEFKFSYFCNPINDIGSDKVKIL